MPLDGRKRYRGVIEGCEGSAAMLFLGDVKPGLPDRVAIPMASMAEARLVLTDDLVKEALRRAKAQSKSAGPIRVRRCRRDTCEERHRTRADAPLVESGTQAPATARGRPSPGPWPGTLCQDNRLGKDNRLTDLIV